MTSGFDDVVAELLATPPKQFTEARNAAAKRLAAEGQREDAGELKKLSRPSLSLWTLNYLAREQPKLIEAFLGAAEALRKAHEGGGDIRAATQPERAAEGRVVAAAADVVRAQGGNMSDTVERGLRQALNAAAADAEVAAALRSGRLLREPDAPSLDQLLGSLPQAPAATTKAARERDTRAERRALQEEIADAKAASAEARDAARAAADAARAAERAWRRAQKLAEQTQERSDAAGERLRELQERLKDL